MPDLALSARTCKETRGERVLGWWVLSSGSAVEALVPTIASSPIPLGHGFYRLVKGVEESAPFCRAFNRHKGPPAHQELPRALTAQALPGVGPSHDIRHRMSALICGK